MCKYLMLCMQNCIFCSVVRVYTRCGIKNTGATRDYTELCSIGPPHGESQFLTLTIYAPQNACKFQL